MAMILTGAPAVKLQPTSRDTLYAQNVNLYVYIYISRWLHNEFVMYEYTYHVKVIESFSLRNREDSQFVSHVTLRLICGDYFVCLPSSRGF